MTIAIFSIEKLNETIFLHKNKQFTEVFKNLAILLNYQNDYTGCLKCRLLEYKFCVLLISHYV